MPELTWKQHAANKHYGFDINHVEPMYEIIELSSFPASTNWPFLVRYMPEPFKQIANCPDIDQAMRDAQRHWDAKQPPATAPMRPQWEYKIINRPHSFDEWRKLIEQAGVQGWELVALSSTDQTIFKRIKQ